MAVMGVTQNIKAALLPQIECTQTLSSLCYYFYRFKHNSADNVVAYRLLTAIQY